MALDVAAGVLLAGIITGIFYFGFGLLQAGIEEDSSGFKGWGGLICVATFLGAAALILDRTGRDTDAALVCRDEGTPRLRCW
jgi:hypothetical protein